MRSHAQAGGEIADMVSRGIGPFDEGCDCLSLGGRRSPNGVKARRPTDRQLKVEHAGAKAADFLGKTLPLAFEEGDGLGFCHPGVLGAMGFLEGSVVRDGRGDGSGEMGAKPNGFAGFPQGSSRNGLPKIRRRVEIAHDRLALALAGGCERHRQAFDEIGSGSVEILFPPCAPSAIFVANAHFEPSRSVVRHNDSEAKGADLALVCPLILDVADLVAHSLSFH